MGSSPNVKNTASRNCKVIKYIRKESDMLAIVFLILVVIVLTISLEKTKCINITELPVEETKYDKTGKNILIKDTTWSAHRLMDECNRVKDECNEQMSNYLLKSKVNRVTPMYDGYILHGINKDGNDISLQIKKKDDLSVDCLILSTFYESGGIKESYKINPKTIHMYSENKDVNSVAYYVMDVIENGNYAIKKRAKSSSDL